ncbi:MAG: undecaprenyl-diphosphate phosphatase [Nitrospirales bacterium]|nr:undecaprenyl-diphosphate phosphatase [Nitrospirales bacterium]
MERLHPELAALLGFVEGLTEYLPVSSTGHLILVGHLFDFTGKVAASIDICIQLGAILAVVVYERGKLLAVFREAFQEQGHFRDMVASSQSNQLVPSSQQWKGLLAQSMKEHRSLWFLVGLGIAFCPAAMIGFFSHDWIEAHLFSPRIVAVSLIVGGLIILAVEWRPHRIRVTQLTHVGLRSAVGVGIAQCVALIPGMSRSGSTIVGGLLMGLDRKIATEYSFFLALPTMFAATGYKWFQSFHLLSFEEALALGIGLVVAFFVAWIVIAVFLAYVKRHTLRVFAYYRIALGSAWLLLLS